DTLHDRRGTIVGHVVMPQVAPPHQDVGRIEVLVGNAGPGIGEPGPGDGNTRLAPELIGERSVDVVRIDRVRGRALAPDPDPQGPLVHWVFTARGLARVEQPKGRQGRGRTAHERSAIDVHGSPPGYQSLRGGERWHQLAR